MASDLFSKYADALSQPSKGYRALEAALGGVEKGISGFERGSDFAEKLRKRKIQQQTLSEALGGRELPGFEAFSKTPVEQIQPIAPLAAFKTREGLSDLEKENLRDQRQERALDAAAARQERALAAMAKRQGASEDSRDRSAVGSLRSQFLRESKEFSDISNRISNVVAGAKDPTAAGDLSLIFSYMKMLDPTSVVREGEFATAANTGSIPDRVVAQYNRVINGERLSSDIRNDFVKRSFQIYDAQKRNQAQREEEFRRLAAAQGLDPSQAVIRIESPVISSGLDGQSDGGAPPQQNTPQNKPIRARNNQGFVIESIDGGQTWRPVNGG